MAPAVSILIYSDTVFVFQLIIFTSLFSIIYRDTMDPGLVGLSLTYTFTFQLDIFLMTRWES